MTKRPLGLVAAGLVLLTPVAASAQSPAPVREITKIAGEVYRFRNNFHYSVFAVTPAGIIVTDPINAEAALKRVEAMDFDLLVPGHGPVGRKEHVRLFREFMEDLRGEVLTHARAGRSLDEVKQLVKLPKYEKWGAYKEWFPLNVEGMYRHVQMHRRGNP
ncbi:MAG: hypothetical protein HYU25_17500 [Candidatus Rokubacteria bacterium]|nr:hypothetical protein [Candidatus Rokubacteria bacterium]